MKKLLIISIVLGGSLLAIIVFILIEVLKRNKFIKTRKKCKKDNVDITNRDSIDYNVYIMTKKEKMIYILIASIVIFLISFIFYRSYIVSAALIPLSFFYPKIKTKEIIKKRKNDLNLQFKEALYALSSSLSAGKSIEMAFKDSLNDLSILYPDPNTYITHEFQYIIRKIDMNETIEEALSDFARRAHLEDINNFVDVFITCKGMGGNIVEILKNTSNVIADKIYIKNDINIMLAQKKLEQKLLNIIPIVLILLLSLNAKDYMELVFETALGKVMMTISIVLLTGAYFISKKIMDIEV